MQGTLPSVILDSIGVSVFYNSLAFMFLITARYQSSCIQVSGALNDDENARTPKELTVAYSVNNAAPGDFGGAVGVALI